jgi:hypothetical protein
MDADVVHADNRRMTQVRNNASFTFKPVAKLIVGTPFQDLHRDRAIELRIAAVVHRTHSTASDQAQDLVSIVEAIADL